MMLFYVSDAAIANLTLILMKLLRIYDFLGNAYLEDYESNDQFI